MIPMLMDRMGGAAELVSMAGAVQIGVKATLVLAAAAGVSIALRRASAAARHLTWALALAGLMVLPALELWLPSWRLPVLPAPRVEAPTVHEAAAAPTATPAPVAVGARGQELVADATEPPILVGAWWAPVPRAQAPESVSPPPGQQKGTSPALLLTLVWAMGAFVLLLRLGMGAVRLAALSRRAEPVTAPEWTRLAGSVASSLGVTRPVRLLRGPATMMPMTWGARRPVILLPASAEAWDAEQRSSVLLHETAHIRRGDWLTQVLADASCAVYWFHPLAWLAARRLRIEAEHACDDQVLAAGSRGSDYAAHLLGVVRGLRTGHLTAVAMARPSQLRGRVVAVLDGSRDRSGVTSRLVAGAVALGALALVPLAAASPGRAAEQVQMPPGSSPAPPAAPPAPAAPAVPGLPVAPDFPAVPEAPEPPARPAAPGEGMMATVFDAAADCSPGGSWRRIMHNSDGHKRTMKWSRRGCDIEFELRGDVEFSDDLDRIARVGRGGLFRLEEEEGRTERELEVRAGADGSPVYAYRLNGRAQTFDAEAQAWLADRIAMMVRDSGIGADKRVTRLLDRGGHDAVLAEVGRIGSSHVKRVYLSELVEQARLNDTAMERVMRIAGSELESDHELAQFLAAAVGAGTSPGVTRAAVAASSGLASDHERRRVLSRVLENGSLGPAEMRAVLVRARETRSDHELAQILVKAAASADLTDAAVRGAYFDALATVDSDHEHRKVLHRLLSGGKLGPAAVLAALASAAAGISSDHEMAQLLVGVAEHYRVDGPVRDAFLRAMDTIGSSHEQNRVAGALLRAERGSGR